MNKKESTPERRFLRLLPDERTAVRAEKDDKGNRYFVGYAAVFNTRSKLIWDWDRVFYEIIKPEAFDTVLSREDLDVPFVLDHNRGLTIARTISGNLTLETDETGLKIRALVPNTTLGNDTYEMVERGDYTDMSFRFRMEESGSKWYKDNEGNLIHEVRDILDLLDVSALTFHGAYGETEIDTEVANRMYDELIREESGSDDEEQGTPPEDPDDGNPEPTPEEIAEKEKAVAADLDEAEMDLDLKKAEYGIEETDTETKTKDNEKT